MKVIPIVAAHYCDYFGVSLVVRFVEIGENFAKNDKKIMIKFARRKEISNLWEVQITMVVLLVSVNN